MIKNPTNLKIRMFGTKPLEKSEHTIPILKIIEGSAQFHPEYWSLNERTKLPYNRKEIENRLDSVSGRAIDDIILKRRKKAKYDARLQQGPRPYISFVFDGKLNSKSWSDIFMISDQLAETFQPDFAVTHVTPQYEDPPWPRNYDRRIYMTAFVANIAPVDYKKFGPLGLGMRTYIGDYYQKQLDRDRLLSTPGCVIDEASYGMRIDLTREPWALDVEEMCDRWEAATSHLEQARVFPELVVDGDWVRPKKGENCKIRRPL